MRTVVLDGKAWPMKEVHRLYKEQRDEERRKKQLTLFDMKEDARPASQTTVAGRFNEPLLFKVD